MTTNRRVLLRGLVASVGGMWLGGASRPVVADDSREVAVEPVQLQIGEEQIATVPADFLGLGYEISSVSRTGLLSASNHHYVRLVRTLSPRGVIRVGGNTSDDAEYRAAGQAISAPVGTIVNRTNLEELGGFLRATSWRLLWGLNLGTGTGAQAVEEATAVARAVGDHLLGFEIGNEPDLFAGNPKHRKRQYGYGNYLREFRDFRTAIQARLPGARFAGPDVADHTDWAERFATDEGKGLLFLTHHYYRECESPASTIDKLLRPDPKLLPELTRLQTASRAAGLGYRICEMNSFCGGGRPGVSDSFGAALWTLDILCLLAAHGCAGVNMETGVNQRGFISSYSPIADDERQHVAATPAFYGMLAFQMAGGGGGAMRRVVWNPGAVNAAAYAFHAADGATRVVLVNKDEAQGMRVRLPGHVREVMRLEAPSLASKTSVTLGGAAVGANGSWSPRRASIVPGNGRVLAVGPASAAIVSLT